MYVEGLTHIGVLLLHIIFLKDRFSLLIRGPANVYNINQ